MFYYILLSVYFYKLKDLCCYKSWDHEICYVELYIFDQSQECFRDQISQTLKSKSPKQNFNYQVKSTLHS